MSGSMESSTGHIRRRSAVVIKAALHKVGGIDLTDLDIISRSYGRDFLPYPFRLTRPNRFTTLNEFREYAISVPDRFNHGDLRTFRRWAASYAHAEIRVECHVQYIPDTTPSVRVVANRVGDLGYLARQRPDEDVVDVYQVSPYDLGRAIADSVELTQPGGLPEIVIPEYTPPADNADTTEGFTLKDVADTTTATEVRRASVTAFGTVQSHWRPTRRWGLDRGKNTAVWVRIKDDGEYLYAADAYVAKPMTTPVLVERTDALIAEDVAALREFRSD